MDVRSLINHEIIDDINDKSILIHNDCFEVMKNISDKSIDLIFSDPPYFLSNNGISCQSGKVVSVNKGSWDKIGIFDEKYNFNQKWIRECSRVLKDNGSIFISGSLHNIYLIGVILEKENFKILNNITWEKTAHHLIFLVDILHIQQRLSYGLGKMI